MNAYSEVSSGDRAPSRASDRADIPPAHGRADEEAAWVERIRRGDEAAFAALFHRHYAELCSFAVSYVGSFDAAREVVQIVFIRIWERRTQWVVASTVRGYLYGAVRNEGLNHARRKRRRFLSLEAHHHIRNLPDASDPEEAACYEEELRAVQRAIEQLPERQRSAFLLSRRHGLTYHEVAGVMEISPRTVEVHIAKALKALYLALRD